jgi:hypothetical protein
MIILDDYWKLALRFILLKFKCWSSELVELSKGVVSLEGTCTFVLPMHEPTSGFNVAVLTRLLVGLST